MANILNVGIGAQLGGLRSGLSQAEKELTSFSQGVEKRLGSISTERLERGLSNIGSASVPAASKLASSMGTVRRSTGNTTSAVINFNRVIQDAPFGIIGVANNIEPLITSFQQLQRTTGSTTGAFKSLLTSAFTGPGALITVTSLASTALLVFGRDLFKTSKQAEELTDSMGRLNKSWEQTIALQRQFGAFEADDLGIEERRAQVREITEDIEEQRAIIRRRNGLEQKLFQLRKQIANADIQDRAALEQQADTIQEQLNSFGSLEQVKLRITNLEDKRQDIIEQLVNKSDALADSETQQARQAQRIREEKERQAQFEEQIRRARESTFDLSREGDVIFDANIDVESIKTAINRFEEMGDASQDAAEKGSTAMRALGDATGGVVGQLIRGQEEAFKFSNIMSAILPALANVLFPGGGFLSGIARGLFGGIFHDGGVVPGPVGQERLILAEAGETVVPRGGSMGGKRVIQVPVYIDNRQVAFAQTSYDETVGR